MVLPVRASNGFCATSKAVDKSRTNLSEKQVSKVANIYLKKKQAAFKNIFLKSRLPW
jgi:hypothetical protein